jgi:ketosteroid isomerase-like protein
MAQENVEIVRRLFDALARRDAKSVLALYDPEVEWDASRAGPGEAFIGGIYHGHEGLRGYFREWYEAWESIEYDCEELVDAGERVMSAVTNRGRGRVSGAELEYKQYAVWTIRDGRIVRVVWFNARDEALEEAGTHQQAQ